ncbi:MAG: hypothetical protein OXN25_17915 [Candidatus Poribacteria bacterium]|nr:hypothetical protein [Candidatus Poribacteria bacterium]
MHYDTNGAVDFGSLPCFFYRESRTANRNSQREIVAGLSVLPLARFPNLANINYFRWQLAIRGLLMVVGCLLSEAGFSGFYGFTGARSFSAGLYFHKPTYLSDKFL